MNLSLNFKGNLGSDELGRAISALERQIKAAIPEITRIFIEAQDRQGARGGRRQG